METRVRSGVGLTVMLIAGLSFPSALLHAEILNCTNVLEYKPDPGVSGERISTERRSENGMAHTTQSASNSRVDPFGA